MRLTLAERMVLIRKRMRITQTELATLLSVSRKTVTRAEAGMKVLRSTRERFAILEQRYRSNGRSVQR